MSTATPLASDDGPALDEERRLRVELAGCYRIFDHLGWSEVIMNHITVRVPGEGHHFLINPYGLRYDEVTASNLVKIDTEGNVVGRSEWPVNPAGFIIHSAIHSSREDAICVMHTHTTEAQAVSVKRGGLNHNSFYAAQLHGRVGYHTFEGVTVHDEEKPRLLASLGRANTVLVMRNHGVLTVGRSIAEAFWNMWRFQRAAEVQAALAGMEGPDVEVPEAVRRDCVAVGDNYGPSSVAETIFRALLRKVRRLDPSFED
ncbi:Decarboxylase NovR [Aquisphaera giovannonii]|uniref:Decarboxylase NovR n=1 Tax=Aquisphaera giovannonii TaxID=406548 RepID=A0A5B9VUG8_9BACT|nr:class II aldolase/adducin family protein [Aquisphaera giovannonii]QEH31734.1 Decarboxylase NovR [Aquisphaera giovannonii]